MSMRKPLIALVAALPLALASGAALAQSGTGLGKPISEADVKQWDIAILPDGSNLPPGSGTAAQGALIYAQKCLACHGENGKGGGAPGAGRSAAQQRHRDAEDHRKLLPIRNDGLRLHAAGHALQHAPLADR